MILELKCEIRFESTVNVRAQFVQDSVTYNNSKKKKKREPY